MIDFLVSFFFDGFESGDYEYGLMHMVSLLFIIFSIIYLLLLYKYKGYKKLNKQLNYIAIITFVIYVFRRMTNLFRGSTIIEAYWPFYLCNINTILICFYQIYDLKKGKEFVIVTGLIGGLITFIMPQGIFTDKYLTLGILDSITSHYILVVIPLVLLFSRIYELKFKNIHHVFIGLILVLFNVEVIQKLLLNTDVDYLFLRGDIPFTLPGVPQFLIISSLAIIFVLIIYILDYIYLSLVKNKSEK